MRKLSFGYWTGITQIHNEFWFFLWKTEEGCRTEKGHPSEEEHSNLAPRGRRTMVCIDSVCQTPTYSIMINPKLLPSPDCDVVESTWMTVLD